MLRLKEKPLVPIRRQLFPNPSSLPSVGHLSKVRKKPTLPGAWKATQGSQAALLLWLLQDKLLELAPKAKAVTWKNRAKNSIPRVKFMHRSRMGEVLVSPSTTLWPLRYRKCLFHTKALTYEYACFNSCLPIDPHICVKLPRGWDGQSCFAVSWELKGLGAPHHYHSE